MQIRLASLLVALSIAFVGSCSCSRNSASSPPRLPDIQSGNYRVAPYIRKAIELQSLGRTKALVQLHSMARDKEMQSRVIVLCRMLFVQRSGSGFRRPMIGGAEFLGGTEYADWPLEPIELVDGVPFLISRGYVLGGKAESDESYLRYCETHCDWSHFRYSAKDRTEMRRALRKLLSSSKWKTPLDVYEKEFLKEQLR